MKSVRSLD